MKISIDEASITTLNNDPGLMEHLKNIAEYAAESARSRVPVDTGKLRDSITTRKTDTGAEMVVEADYALYVEYGSSTESAHPYIRPAIDDSQRAYGG